MPNLISFTSAHNWQEKVFVDPADVSVIKRLHKDRDMGEYSEIIMKNGERVAVCGLPSDIAIQVRNEAWQ